MASPVGKQGSDLGRREGELHHAAEHLREDPNSYGFFQALRVLQRLSPGALRLGHFGDPRDEPVRIGVNPNLALPASEIQDLERDEDGRWQMTANVMGLVGHFGVLPHHYSVLASERLRSRDPALMDFLDMFHHRIMSLFYRAWERSRFYAAYERGDRDGVTEHLYDLLGIGTERLRSGLGGEGRSLLFYVGLMASQTRSAVSLEQLLEDYFGVPATVEQFVGSWHSLARAVQCRVDDEVSNDSSSLGMGAVVGDEIWDPQGAVRIVLGPLSRAQYDRFLPSGADHAGLKELVRFFSNDQYDIELKLVLVRDEVPPVELGSETSSTPLGWSSWLRSEPFTHDADETVLTL